MNVNYSKLLNISNYNVSKLRETIINFIGHDELVEAAQKVYDFIPNEFTPLSTLLGLSSRLFKSSEMDAMGIDNQYTSDVSDCYASLILDIVLQQDNLVIDKFIPDNGQYPIWHIRCTEASNAVRIKKLTGPKHKPYKGKHTMSGSMNHAYYSEEFHCPETLKTLEEVGIRYLYRVAKRLPYPEPELDRASFEVWKLKHLNKVISYEEWVKQQQFQFDCYGRLFQGKIRSLRDRRRLYIPYRYDSRGRIYAQGDVSNFTGDKHLRGIIEFSKKVLVPIDE